MLPGLVRVLKRMSDSTLIDTIVPGRIYQATKTIQSSTVGTVLQLKLTTSRTNHSSEPQQQGLVSQKIIARTTSQAQEVFLSFKQGSFNSSEDIKAHVEGLLQKEKDVEVCVQLRSENNRSQKSLLEIAMNRKIYWN